MAQEKDCVDSLRGKVQIQVNTRRELQQHEEKETTLSVHWQKEQKAKYMEGDQSNTLPPLPPSDSANLNKNTYIGVYEIGAKDFWGKNEVTYHEVKPFSLCEHTFMFAEEGIVCRKCHMGLIGTCDIHDGTLFIAGKPVRFIKE